MDIRKTIREQPAKVLKIAGVALVGLLILVIVVQLLSAVFRPLVPQFAATPGKMAPSMMGGGNVSYDGDGSYGYAVSESALMPELSSRNVAVSTPAPYPPQQTTGDDAEAYEVTDYDVSIETRHLSKTCDAVQALKVRDDVVFESSNSYDRGCSVGFKVKHESVEAVLAIIEELDPKQISEHTYTIKAQIEDFTSEVEVLEKKRAAIDETLENALDAYDDITRLATNTQNADALAKIIDSKVGIIERLTQERININAQLDRLARAKAEQLDRLEYTYFSVRVYESTFVDGEQIKDSWKEAVREFIRTLNEIVQGLTINLFLVLFFVLQWAIYALIALVVVKYGWKLALAIWKH